MPKLSGMLPYTLKDKRHTISREKEEHIHCAHSFDASRSDFSSSDEQYQVDLKGHESS